MIKICRNYLWFCTINEFAKTVPLISGYQQNLSLDCTSHYSALCVVFNEF